MTLDPELAGLLHHVGEAKSFAELFSDPTGAQSLEAFSAGTAPYQVLDVPIRTVAVPGPNGPVPVRIYGPPASDGSCGSSPETSGTPVPALVWAHGGGFAGGGLDMREADQLARELAVRTGGVVLSVDYRLARDGIHFPVPHEDVLAAWLWTVEHAPELGADPRRLCLGGASAGGNLAVGAALYLKDSGRQLPAKLVLAYPFLHAVLPATSLPASEQPVAHATDGAEVDGGGAGAESVMEALPKILRFTPDDSRRLVENYIGGPLGMAPAYAMPGNADPSGLPPVAVLACEYDDLCFSSEQFAARLRAVGIEVEFRLERGATHGILNHSAGLDIVQRGLAFLAAAVTSAKLFQ